MTLSDWNKLIEYGKELCAKLNFEGYNVALKPYTEYYSGIDLPHIMQIQMETNARRIKQECK